MAGWVYLAQVLTATVVEPDRKPLGGDINWEVVIGDATEGIVKFWELG